MPRFPITLIDTALQPDTLAEQEMGAPTPREDGSWPEAITDLEIHGCRLLLVLQDVTPLQLNGSPGGAVALSCTFQPTGRLRFVHARLTITLEQPEGVRIIDLSPRTSPKEPVNITIDHRGRLGFEFMGANVGAEVGRQIEFQQYHCQIRGSGADDQPARWDFSEHPQRQDGLANDHSLFLTLPSASASMRRAISRHPATPSTAALTSGRCRRSRSSQPWARCKPQPQRVIRMAELHC